MIIDAWIQHPTDRLLAQPMFDSLKRWTGQDAVNIPVEFTVATMRHSDISTALLSAWYGPQGPLISNEEVHEIVQQYPDQFAGIAGVDIRNPMAAIKELRKCIGEYGFKGLRIIQWLWDLPCSHALYYPLLAECVNLDIPVCFQVGLTGPLMSSSAGKPEHIERIALDFPDLKIVCGHIGYPWHIEMIAYATKFPNVYIDTSAYKITRYPAELVHFMKAHGSTKVLFGSNYPMITPDACLKGLNDLGLDEKQARRFLYSNAKRVFGL